MNVLRTFLKLLFDRGVYKSYSQFGEDLIIRPFLPKGNGFYVDVGCYHPVLYSNTYRLYRQGWQGIVIDPNRKLQKLFSLFRPRDAFVQTGIGSSPEQRTYFEFTDGAYNTFDPVSAEKYKTRTKLLSSYPVAIRTLADVLTGVDRIDLLNIDTEGLDLEVLQSYDWRVKPKLIIIEAMPSSPAGALLIGKGYTLVGLTKLNSIFLLK